MENYTADASLWGLENTWVTQVSRNLLHTKESELIVLAKKPKAALRASVLAGAVYMFLLKTIYLHNMWFKKKLHIPHISVKEATPHPPHTNKETEKNNW